MKDKKELFTVEWRHELLEVFSGTGKKFTNIYTAFLKNKLRDEDIAEKELINLEKKCNLLTHKALENNVDNYSLLVVVFSNLEKINFDLRKLLSFTNSKIKEGTHFTVKATEELRLLFTEINQLFPHLYDAIITENPVLTDFLLNKVKELDKKSRQFSTEHEERLIKGVCLTKSSSVYLYILDSLQDLLWHFKAIVRELPKTK